MATSKKSLQTLAQDRNFALVTARHPALEVFSMFIANRAALVAMVVLMANILAAIYGSMVYKTDPFEMVWAPFTLPGTEGFILGTDYLGRDLLAGLLHGGRVSITIGLVAALMSVFIGISFGAFAGYYRGYVEEVLMRITEFFQVLPHLAVLNGDCCAIWCLAPDDHDCDWSGKLDGGCSDNTG